MAARSACLGEIALLFAMTRPIPVETTVAFDGPAPRTVWLLLAAYAGIGGALLALAAALARKARRKPPIPLS